MPEVNRPAASSGGRVVSATEAVRSFRAIVARVLEERAVYVVERRGKPVAEIGPVADPPLTGAMFAEIVRSGSAELAGAEYLRAVEHGIALLNRAEVPGDPWER